MLEVIGAAPGSHTDINWHKTWRESPEYQKVHDELDRLKEELPKVTQPSSSTDDRASFREFAAPFGAQQWEVTKRVFEQYWRTPSYIYSKASLCIFSVRSSCILRSRI
jgi:ATP-binding cassette, subfamily G (WHITE), member 2, PDR